MVNIAKGKINAAMLRAFKQAQKSPAGGLNPQVGCVLIDNKGKIVAQGHHKGKGTPHAEVAALSDATNKGLKTAGLSAVVTLEPCDHQGQTPPCTKALIEAGIKHVYYALSDPNPLAAGGHKTLNQAGITTTKGVRQSQGEELLARWINQIKVGRPHVILKSAATLDGKIAASDSTSKWITGAKARQYSHKIREQVGAIAVGTYTVLTDDPTLNARKKDGTAKKQQPQIAIIGNSDIPKTQRVIKEHASGQVTQYKTHDLNEVLASLYEKGVGTLLVEGGATLNAAFLKADLVDEIHYYLAPKILGNGKSAYQDLGITTINDAKKFSISKTKTLTPDLLIILKRS